MLRDIDSLTQPIINIYSQIELDLIKDIAKRFDVNDEIGGTMEWQLKKLDELGMLNSDTVKTIAKYSDKSEAEIYKMLEKSQFANINMSDLNEAKAATAELEAELAQAHSKNAELKSDIASLGTDKSIEELARQKLGLVKSDEIVFIDMK